MSAEPQHAPIESDGERDAARGEAAHVPHGDAARALPPCDLVMKGGITSGVVYPGLVQRLAANYRFASIGGTSVGAIAAGVCAAAEYGRQGGDPNAMARLDAIMDDLARPGFVLGLFQPTPGTRRLFETLTSAMSPRVARARAGSRLLVTAAQLRWEVVLGAVVVLAGLATLTVASFGGLPAGVAAALAVLIALPLAGIVIVGAGLLALGLLVAGGVRSLDRSGFGMCPGMPQPGGAGDALVEWLHEQIQTCAGRTTTHGPLTFRDLADAGIELRMMTTDLSFARPVTVPGGLGGYLFDPAEMSGHFPGRVVDAMMPATVNDPREAARIQYIPTDDLPVLVGVRMSLGIPLLISAIPLYLSNPDTTPPVMRHLFSDGGISSNFPVHFFDAWFPSRPTFGVELVENATAEDDDVFMLDDPSLPLPPRRREIGSVLTFLAAIFDTLQNWRDTLQTELPGFRDRICQIRFEKGQGGLHLDMSPDVVADLMKRGRDAGDRILEEFDAQARWDQHRFVRYLTLMAELQDNLRSSADSFGTFAPDLAAGLPGVTIYREGHDAAWCARAAAATEALLAVGAAWGPPPHEVDFDT